MKPTNPKQAIAINAAPLDNIPLAAQAYASVALANGALKYGTYNWRVSGVRASVYLAAAQRHIQCWREGEELDAKDGVHNLGAAIACLSILIDALENECLTDDRPTAAKDPRGVLDRAAEQVKHLRELHKNHSPIHYYIKGYTEQDSVDLAMGKTITSRKHYDPFVMRGVDELTLRRSEGGRSTLSTNNKDQPSDNQEQLP
jgi:hypothetical protein